MKTLRVAIRADAARWIGSGHIQRCLTLATVLRERGAEIFFLCRVLPGNLCHRIEEQGFTVVRLATAEDLLEQVSPPYPYASWLGVPLAQEIGECQRNLAAIGPLHTLIVDHYGVDATWEEAMRPWTGQILALDDLADRRHACDLLLDPALRDAPGAYAGLLPAGSRCLHGPRYALLRPEFARLRANIGPRSGVLKRLLVFMGGHDPHNLTGQILQAIAGMEPRPPFGMDIVLGESHPGEAGIRALCRPFDGWKVHVATPDMPALMAKGDLMIGTPGGTTWERCCLGLPAILFVAAANQVENARQMARRRAAIVLPFSLDAALAALPGLLARLTESPTLLAHLSRRALHLTDGGGTRRVANIVLSDRLELRPAAAPDCDMLWHWRNDPHTRRTAFNADPIPLDSHRAWFEKAVADPQRRLLIGEVGGDPVGVLRYDLDGNRALVSTYLDPEMHGTGLGRRLIACGSRWLAEAQPELDSITALIRPENRTSHQAFSAAGFLPLDSTEHEIALIWRPHHCGRSDEESL